MHDLTPGIQASHATAFPRVSGAEVRLFTTGRCTAFVLFVLLCMIVTGCAGGASSTTTSASGPAPMPTPVGGPSPTPTPGPTPSPTPTPSGHSVALSWSPSSSTDVVSYNVYRSSASSGPFTKIGNASGTNFTDSSVQAGQTYFYTVTSVDNKNVESTEPTPVSVTTPSS